MKRTVSILVIVLLTLSLFGGCGSRKAPAQSPETAPPADVSEPGGDTDSETSGAPRESGDVIVVYFSCTGNTKPLAGYIQDELNADIYEIVPKEPYTAADIDYNTDCRASREQQDPSARPAIAGELPDLSGYGTVYLGYPIWYGQAPKIMYTFLESMDLSGKTVIPFCTSGSSPVGTSAENLHASAPDAQWKDGARFAAGTSKKEIKEWLNTMNAQNELSLRIGDREIPVTWQSNAAVDALRELARSGLTVQTSPYGGFEQVGSLGAELPTDDSRISAKAGDIMLYSGNQIVLFYGSNTWEYTRLGHIDLSKAEITELLTQNGITITVTNR